MVQSSTNAFAAPQRARIGAHDEVIEATAGLIALNARAAGNDQAALALPALSRVARLARSLQTPVARMVVVGDDDVDLELHVRAIPSASVVELHIERVTVRAPRSSWLGVQSADTVTTPPVALPWTWRSNASLVVTALSLSPDDPSPLVAADVIGRPLTRLVRFIEDECGDLPIVTALATGVDLRAQRATRRDAPGVEWTLTAWAERDATDRLIGFTGHAEPAAVEATVPMPIIDAAVTHRLQEALRGPLDRIIGRADTIGAQSEGPLRRDYADYAGDIARAGRHLLGLVDDLADLEAVENPQFAVEKDPIDVADLARRGAGLLAVRAASAGVRIDAPASDEVSLARGDFRRTLQIVVNLIGNAVRYSPPGGMIWVRIEDDADAAVLIVADQGKGISAADHERIFDKFERVDPGESEGSGLGLYISRRLARAMGGDIVVDSAPGQGARFVLTLPTR